MSFRAPAAGVQVGRGHVRVDARRALAKLREYQLADPIDWVLEGIRAGVASSATQLILDGDANDVWLAWEGPTWPKDEIPELLSELVSPASAEASRRLLARAINSALGARAEFVDVYTLATKDTQRFRFTPESFAETGATESATSVDERPELAPDTGMLIHVRRRLGLEVLRNALRGEPPELERARHACWSHQVPIAIRTESLPTADARHLLLVELGRGLDGYLALTHPAFSDEAMGTPMSLAEHGVLLERRHVVLYPDAEEVAGVPQLLAIYVNADRLPSNASRSKVREDTHPMTTAMAALPAAIDSLMEILHARLVEDPDQPLLHRAALTLLARYAGGANWPARLWSLPAPLQRLADLPLVRNAMGESRPVRSRWQAQSPHLGRSPYPEEFSPWMSDIPWLPKDDPAALLYGDSEPHGELFKYLAKRARRGLKRQRSFMKQEPAAPVLEDTRDFFLWGNMGSLHRDSTLAPFRRQLSSIEGQIGLGIKGKKGELRLRSSGREIENIETTSPVPFTAVVESPSLVPRPDYRAVERNQAFDYLYRALMLQLVGLVECLLVAKEGELTKGIRVDSRRVLEADSRRWTSWALHLLSRAKLQPAPGSPLARQPHVADVEGRLHSLDDLRTHPVLAATSAESPGSRPSHLLLRASLQGSSELTTLLGPETELIFYPPEALRKPASSLASLHSQMSRSSEPIAILEPQHPLQCGGRELRGAIAWSSGQGARLHVQHLSMNLVDRPLDAFPTPSEVLVRADFLHPRFLSPEQTDLEGLDELDYRPWHDELFWASCRYLVAGSRERVAKELGLTLSSGPDKLARRVLLASTTVNLRDESERLSELVAAAPILPTTRGWRSVDELLESQPETLHYLAPASRDAVAATNLGWEVLLLTEEEAAAAAALLSRPVVDGHQELTRRHSVREFERRRQEHLKGLAVTAREIEESRTSRAPRPVIRFRFEGAEVRAWPGLSSDKLSITVIVEGRLHSETSEFFPMPLEVVVDGGLELLDSRFGLRGSLLQALRDAVEDRAEELVLATGEDPRALGNSTPVQQFLRSFLLLHPDNAALIDHMRKSIRFYSVRGEARTIDECCQSELLRIGKHSGPWLEGEVPHPVVDAPILRIAETGDSELTALLLLLAPPMSDTTDAIFAVQAQRRVEQGLVARPSLEGREVSAISTFSGLSKRDLGAGEMGLCDEGCPPFLLIYSDGQLQSELPNWSRLPIAVAIDNPALRRQLGERGGLDDEWRQALELAAIEFLRRIGDEVEGRLLGSSDTPLETSIRYLLLAGHELPPSLGEVPLFPSLHGPKKSWSELCALDAAPIWYVASRVDLRPLDEARLVLVLSDEEIPAHPRLHLHEASEELRKDELARTNREQAPLRDLELPAAIARAALASASGEKLEGALSALAVLETAELRGVDVVHEDRLLCTLPDPCPWPTAAVVSADAFGLRINRTHDGVETGPELDVLVGELRRASRRLLLGHFKPPQDRLASSQYLASITGNGVVEELPPSAKRLGESVKIVAGRLWLSGAAQSHGLLVSEGGEIRRREPRPGIKGANIALPIEGVLHLSDPRASLSQQELDYIASSTYRDLVRRISSSWSKTSRDERHESHVKLALSLDLVSPEHVKAPSLAHEGGRLTPSEYARLPFRLEAHEGVLDDDEVSSAEAELGPLVFAEEEEEVEPALDAVGEIEAALVEIEEEPAAPAETALVSWLRIQLHELHLSPYFSRLTLEDGQREHVDFEQGWLRLGAASTYIRQLSQLAESGSEDRLPMFDLLLHIACLLEDGAPAFSEALHAATIGKLLMKAAGSSEGGSSDGSVPS